MRLNEHNYLILIQANAELVDKNFSSTNGELFEDGGLIDLNIEEMPSKGIA